MKAIGGYPFPETSEELIAWSGPGGGKVIRHVALATRVLVAANTREEGSWCAYCDAVPGMLHSAEVDMVLLHGDKLPEALARAIFPEFKEVPYAN